MNEELPFPVYLFPIFFPILWCSILYMLSQMSGWHRVAKTFAYDEKIAGEYLRFQSAQINGVNFNSALEIGINDVGLTMAPFFLFRLFHKRILLPWNYLRAEEYKKWLFSGYKLTLIEDKRFTIVISKKLFKKMQRFL
ncbi:hypothetical protein [Cerasicoccus fimbriatus]|uniref:hypothetical protein n=1 Tax=Cerasicoccus fimbriatus TaxID=3014554 RepID=UPI0022B3261B|nr:hypothetical protein [Cerasicoccus sp. TK19100]